MDYLGVFIPIDGPYMRQLMRSASVAIGQSARLALRSLKGILLECMQNWLRFVNLSAAT